MFMVEWLEIFGWFVKLFVFLGCLYDIMMFGVVLGFEVEVVIVVEEVKDYFLSMMML